MRFDTWRDGLRREKVEEYPAANLAAISDLEVNTTDLLPLDGVDMFSRIRYLLFSPAFL